MAVKSRIVRRRDGWWVVDLPALEGDTPEDAECGPYRTKAEARSDQRGMERFYANINRRSFFTSERVV